MPIFSRLSKKNSNYTCHLCTGSVLLFSNRSERLCVSSLCRPCFLYRSKKKQNLTTLLRLYVSFLCRSHATVSRKKRKSSSLCRVRYSCRLLREIRTFGRAVEGSSMRMRIRMRMRMRMRTRIRIRMR